MTNEQLKPCPFCGGEASSEDPMPDMSGKIKEPVRCENRRCQLGGLHQRFTIKEWNSRPLEDAKAKRIAELEAQLQWRDIATAPKDGTEFLVSDEDGDMTVMHYIYGKIEPYCMDTDSYYHSVECAITPTHWMPLPQPPQQTEGE